MSPVNPRKMSRYARDARGDGDAGVGKGQRRIMRDVADHGKRIGLVGRVDAARRAVRTGGRPPRAVELAIQPRETGMHQLQ